MKKFKQNLSYLDLINRFHDENRRRRFTVGEMALYYFLLNEANRSYWQMPLCCPMGLIMAYVPLSKSTILRAREGLRDRGLITYENGSRSICAPTYTIILGSEKMTEEVADSPIVSDYVTGGVTGTVTGGDTGNETCFDTRYDTNSETRRDACSEAIYISKDKDKNKDKDKESDNTRTRVQIKKNFFEERELPLSTLKEKLMADTQWQEEIIRLVRTRGLELPPDRKISDFLDDFFGYLNIQGVTAKNERDCRAHFFNKLVKEYLNTKTNKPTSYENDDKYSKRRGVFIGVHDQRNYDLGFFD